MLLLANNFLFALMLACPMIPGAARYFANTYICLGIIMLLSFLNYRLYKAIRESLTSGGSPKLEKGQLEIKGKDSCLGGAGSCRHSCWCWSYNKSFCLCC